MDELRLDALGTNWSIVVDDDVLEPSLRRILSKQIHDFDEEYSRFKPESPLSHLNTLDTSVPIPISQELETMLSFGLQLSYLTDGLFDANVANWEKAYGYDETYSFKDPSEVTLPNKGTFSIHDHHLLKKGTVALDLGAFGKGFLIDLLATTLRHHHKKHFLVDGGRDFFATSKADGSAWIIGLEHPTDPSLAIGIVPLKNAGFAASNSFHRKVGTFHHILNGQNGKPTTGLASVFTIAKSAMEADGLSTAIFVTSEHFWPQLHQHFEFEYLSVTPSLLITRSQKFPGELFLKQGRNSRAKNQSRN